MDAVSLEVRFLLTLALEVFAVTFGVLKLVRAPRRRVLAFVAFAVVVAFELVAFDYIAAPATAVGYSYGTRGPELVSMTSYETYTPWFGFARLRVMVLENEITRVESGSVVTPMRCRATLTPAADGWSVAVKRFSGSGEDRVLAGVDRLFLIEGGGGVVTESRSFEAIWPHRSNANETRTWTRHWLQGCDRSKMDAPLRRFLELEKD